MSDVILLRETRHSHIIERGGSRRDESLILQFDTFPTINGYKPKQQLLRYLLDSVATKVFSDGYRNNGAYGASWFINDNGVLCIILKQIDCNGPLSVLTNFLYTLDNIRQGVHMLSDDEFCMLYRQVKTKYADCTVRECMLDAVLHSHCNRNLAEPTKDEFDDYLKIVLSFKNCQLVALLNNRELNEYFAKSVDKELRLMLNGDPFDLPWPVAFEYRTDKNLALVQHSNGFDPQLISLKVIKSRYTPKLHAVALVTEQLLNIPQTDETKYCAIDTYRFGSCSDGFGNDYIQLWRYSHMYDGHNLLSKLNQIIDRPSQLASKAWLNFTECQLELAKKQAIKTMIGHDDRGASCASVQYIFSDNGWSIDFTRTIEFDVEQTTEMPELIQAVQLTDVKGLLDKFYDSNIDKGLVYAYIGPLTWPSLSARMAMQTQLTEMLTEQTMK